MTIDSVLLSTIARLALAAFVALLGVVVLFRARRLPWLFSGAAAYLLGLLLVRFLDVILANRTNDASRLSWEDLIPVVAAVLGALAGRYRRVIANVLIGAATGGALAIWFAQMIILPADTVLDFWAVVTALGVMVLGMVLGMLFVLRYGDVALIVISAPIGASLIIHGLALPVDSQLAAAFALAAGIAGLVVQYHDYLVDLRAAHRAGKTSGTPESATGEATTAAAAALPAK